MSSTPTKTTEAAHLAEAPATAAAPAAGQSARHEFGAAELATRGDINAQRAAAEAQALVQARYVMALQRPRDMDDVRVRIMREVERPGFAEAAYYRKPIGKGVEGLSVRFAEAAARCLGNLLIDPQTTYEDEARRVVKVTLTDLEVNNTFSLDVTVEKTVERRSLADGRLALSMRKNSSNEITYTVRATEDEMLGKTNSFVSKARRNLILQVLPGDIQDAAKARIIAIKREGGAKDPEGARRKIVDAFATLNVLPSDLKRLLGHDIDKSSPAEIEDLRELYTAIVAGDTTWADAEAARAAELGEPAAAPAAPKAKPGLDGVVEDLQRKAEAPAPAAPAANAAPGEPVCPDHPTQTIVNGDGSRSCFACDWKAPHPQSTAAVVEDLKRTAAVAGDTTKAPDKAKPRQGRLE